MKVRFVLLILLLFVPLGAQDRFRARQLALEPGVLPTGELNAITDVAGVRVGHVTLIEGDDIRTGVTAILPHPGNLFLEKVPAAVHVANGFGKLMGSTQIEELGNLETPVLLTATLNVPRVADSLIEYMIGLQGMEEVRSINPVVGETNDGYLNEIRRRRVGKLDVFEAIRRANSGPVAEGSVGAGTGTRCYGFKGGIGTSSRVLPQRLGGYTVGVLVQSNFGGVLRMGGAPVGRELGRYYLSEEKPDSSHSTGSCMIVAATDAPLLARNLKRLARRAMLGLAATGGTSTSSSGDYVIAFSTALELRIPHESTVEAPGGRQTSAEELRNSDVSPLFQAVNEATEEAIYNSMLMATTIVGRAGHRSEAISIERIVEILRKHKAIPESR